MAYQVTTERQHKPRSGLAMGGLGCGWFELRQDGQFHNWRIFNNAPVGMGAPFQEEPHSVLFFLIRYQLEGNDPRLVLLQIEESHSVAGLSGHEFHYIFPWLSGVDRISYSASFPFASLQYSERDMPLDIALSAWSPFIPRNAADSALPAVFFEFNIRSTSTQPVDVQLVASMRNWVGYDVTTKAWTNRVIESADFRAFEMSCSRMDNSHDSFGSMGIASLHPSSHYYCGWGHPHPYYERLLREPTLPDLDDTPARNSPDSKHPSEIWAAHPCFSSIGRAVRLEQAGETLEHTFVASWDFPNRKGRVPGTKGSTESAYLEEAVAAQVRPVNLQHNEGHYYSNFFNSASAVASYAARNIVRLREETKRFHSAFFDSTLPGYALDQVNSHLNTFRTSSWFTRDGNFGILEGLSPTRAFAGLSTVDVAMYGGIATAALFPELEKAIIRSHAHFQQPDGSILHSIAQNFRQIDPKEATGGRLDLPAQFAFMALRAAVWFGDRDFLKEIWPAVVAALNYGLKFRDKDGDGLPDMEGIMCSYDNFPMFGIAPYVATQWLAAYSIAATAAKLLGESETQARFQELLERGTAILEKKAWNGSYYRLSVTSESSDEGCLADQMFGQWAVRQVNLPSLLNEGRVRRALRSILEMNYRKEQGLRNCQWPGDIFLHNVDADCWVDQANTCWSGVELAFASLLIHEGFEMDGLEIIRNVDARYRRWGNFWDHQEFGGHYFRPMSSWGIIQAALGFSAVDNVVTFDPKVHEPNGHCRLFFITADGYGRYESTEIGVRIVVLSGSLRMRKLRIRDGEQPFASAVIAAGSSIGAIFQNDFLTADFLDTVAIPAGEKIKIAYELSVQAI